MLRSSSHTLLHVVRSCQCANLKPVKLLATGKRTQQLLTLLGQQCWKFLRPLARSFMALSFVQIVFFPLFLTNYYTLYHTQKQREIKIKRRLKLNHNTFGICRWGYVAETREPCAYIRLNSAKICYPIYSSRLRPGSLQISQNFKGGWFTLFFFLMPHVLYIKANHN